MSKPYTSSQLPIFLAVAFICSTFLLGCQPQTDIEKKLVVSPFYNGTSKLWSHRVNNLDRAQEIIDEFNGIEIDIHFDTLDNRYLVYHDSSDTNRTELALFLHEVFQDTSLFAWLDFKNLYEVDHSLASAKLKELLERQNLSDRVIVESWDQWGINALKHHGLYTSYWVPHFENRSSEDTLRILEAIRQMEDHGTADVYSADESMYDLLQQYFPSKPLHLWTNELSGAFGQKRIEQLASDDQVKVVLVDYDTNFLVKD